MIITLVIVGFLCVIMGKTKFQVNKKTALYLSIWITVLVLEVILPIKYWYENFGLEIYNSVHDWILIGWQFAIIGTIIAGYLLGFKWNVFVDSENL